MPDSQRLLYLLAKCLSAICCINQMSISQMSLFKMFDKQMAASQMSGACYHILIQQMSVGQMSHQPNVCPNVAAANVCQPSVSSTKCPLAKYLSPKCLLYKCPTAKCLSAICCIKQMSFCQMSVLKMFVNHMAFRSVFETFLWSLLPRCIKLECLPLILCSWVRLGTLIGHYLIEIG